MQPERTLQKVMTFNKDLFLHARSVENSVEDVSKSKVGISTNSITQVRNDSSSL